MALTREPQLWTWGYNESFQLGWADAVGNTLLRVGFQKPRQPLSLAETPVAIACGEAHSACLTAGGELYAWGDNSTGQCGAQGGLGMAVPLPVAVPMSRGDAHVVRLLCNGNATLAITTSGRAYTLGGGGRINNEKDEDSSEDDGVEGDDEDGILEDDTAGGNGTQAASQTVVAAAAPSPSAQPEEHQRQQEEADFRRGLGRLLGTRRLLAENVADAAGCEDHLLLLTTSGTCEGLGYNRYGQACPEDERLRVAEPTALPDRSFGLQRLLALAVGGGCSLALTEARETLTACCTSTIKAALQEGDAERCAELLILAYTCQSPALASLASAAEACVQRHRKSVRAAVDKRCRAAGIEIDLEDAISALNSMMTDVGSGGEEVSTHS
jgi:alpha-tubulin suppressor-like RCC1 family protein